jgi:hypothetical protein
MVIIIMTFPYDTDLKQNQPSYVYAVSAIRGLSDDTLDLRAHEAQPEASAHFHTKDSISLWKHIGFLSSSHAGEVNYREQ